jgi:DNA (cytosine-5)-methyltransferase 1
MQPSRGSADIVKSLTVGSLFAGIGGFDLGFERAGFEIKWQVEIDPFCRAVLEKHWPHVGRYEDVRRCKGMARSTHAEAGDTDFGPESDTWEDRGWPTPNGVEPPDRPNELEYVDVICGGFPCQDISVGNQHNGGAKGLAGARSGLWSEYRRLIEDVCPSWVVIENVVALRSRGLDQVLRELVAIGYDAEWYCIPASAVGALHRRDRIWIVAYPQREQLRQQPRRWNGAGGPSAALTAVDGKAWPLANADPPRLEGWLRAELRECACQLSAGASGSSGIAGTWIAESDIRRVADGVPSRVDRLKSLGNAVIPQIPEIIGRAILEWERRQ